MSSTFRRTPVVAVASLSLLAGGTALLAGVSSRAADQAAGQVETATSTTTGSPATTAATTTIGGGSTSTTIAQTTTTRPAGFLDAAEARDAAQSLVSAYIESQYSADVADPACSLPPTGAAGDEFVCYALRQGDLVIALRATIGDDRLITLELITDQGAPTTTTTTTTSTTVAAPVDTSAG